MEDFLSKIKGGMVEIISFGPNMKPPEEVNQEFVVFYDSKSHGCRRFFQTVDPSEPKIVFSTSADKAVKAPNFAYVMGIFMFLSANGYTGLCAVEAKKVSQLMDAITH